MDAAAGTVTLNAETTITDADTDSVVDVTAATIDLDAVTGIGATGSANNALDVDGTVTANNATSGGIFLNALGTDTVVITTANAATAGAIEIYGSTGVTLTDIDTANGNITVSVTGADITATAVDTLADNTTITMTTTTSGNMIITHLEADTGNNAGTSETITLTSAGTITSGNTGVINVESNVLTIDDATSVGESGSYLQTDVTTANVDGVDGAVYINDVDTTSADGIAVNANQNVANTSPGALNVTTAAGAIDIDSGAAAIGSNLYLGVVNAASGGSTVTISSNDTLGGDIGNVYDAGTGVTSVTATTLTIDDARDIGEDGDNPLNTTVANLALSNVSGDTYILESDALIIDEATTAIGGLLDIESAGAMTVAGDVTVTGASTIRLDSDVAAMNIGTTADATITGVTGLVTIEGGDVTVGGAGSLFDGIITTAGSTGDIKIDASGALVLADTTGDTTKIDSGGWLDIDPTDVTINAAGLQANDFITITATGIVTNNSTIFVDTADGYITIDAGSIVQAGDITTTIDGTPADYVTLTVNTAITDITDGTTDITTSTLNIVGDTSVATTIGADAGGGPTTTDATWLDTDVTTLNISDVDGDVYVLENDLADDDIRLGTIVVDLASDEDFAVHAIDAGATNPGISVHSVDAAAGTVTLNAETTITDADTDSVVDVTAATIDLDAVTGIGATGSANNALDVDGTVTANNATSGGIFLNALGTDTVVITTANAATAGAIEIYGSTGVTLTDIDTANGNITVSVTGADITATAVDTLADNTTITMTTTTSGNMIITHLEADTGNNAGNSETITLTSAGTITSGNTGVINVESNVLTIDDATSVGESGSYLQTDVTTANVDGVDGAVYINDVDTTSADGIAVNANQNVANTSPGALNVTTAAGAIDIDSGAAAIGSNLYLGVVNAASGASTVTISSNDTLGGDIGNIYDAGTGVTSVTATTLTIDDARDIGEDGDNPLNTTVANLALSNVSGDTYILESDALIIDVADTAMNGSLDIRSAGTMEVDGVIGLDTANKNVVLEAQGAASSLNVNANIDVLGAGTIDLTAGQNLQVAEDTDATVTAVNGNVTVTAGGNVTIGDTTNNTDGIVTTAGGTGDIKITATGNVVMESPATDDTTKIDAGGSLTIDPVDVTIDEAGLQANDFISIVATGTVTNNSTIYVDTADGYIEIDAGSIVQSGDITTTMDDTPIDYVTLTADTTITDPTSGTTDITTTTLTMDAGSGIGVATELGRLDTDVDHLAATTDGYGVSGTAQAGASTTITLAVGASSTDDAYNGRAIVILSGTGVGQIRTISDYDGTTKVATISAAWITTPDTTSAYGINNGDIIITEWGTTNEGVELQNIRADHGSIVLECVVGGMTYQSGDITAGGSTLTMIQEDSIDLSIFTFTNQENTDLMLYSTGSGTGEGDVTVVGLANGGKDENAADQWQSVQAKAYYDIILEGSDLVRDIVVGVHAGGNPFDALHTFGYGIMGAAQAGASATITLAAGASGTDDAYNGQEIEILSGTGAKQIRTISDYDGATKIATVSVAWATTPDTTSAYGITGADGTSGVLHGGYQSASGVGGGVSVKKSTVGTIYTYGHTTLDYVRITGFSDNTGSNAYGVPLPHIDTGEAAGKAAIVLLNETETLELGSNATLVANGTYDSTTVDDRDGINFLDNLSLAGSGKFPGDPIDVAIYVGSYNPAHETGIYNPTSQTGDDVVFNASVATLAEGATMAIDAYDTVTFGTNFASAAGSLGFGTGNVLEVCSRVTETIQDAWILGTLPHVDEYADGLLPSWFSGDKYVLRGGEKDAWVLQFIKPVPIPPPMTFMPEDINDVEEDCNDLRLWAAKELGIENTQVYYIEDTLAQSTNVTHRQICEIYAGLAELAEILSDADGARLSALTSVIDEFAQTSKELSYEQVAMIVSILMQHIDDGTHYAAAGEWLGAMSAYVNILNAELGWSNNKSIEFVMRKYGSKLIEGQDTKTALFVWMYLERN